MSYNFHIGQDVVCIKSHSKGLVLKDEIYPIKALRTACCGIDIDVGKICFNEYGSGLYESVCRLCGNTKYEGTSNVYWLSSLLFAPLDELTDISELQEVLEQPLFQVK